jgi:phage baseplate assembly protein W
MDPSEKNLFIGTGWSFPPTFSTGYGGVKMTSGVEDIESSLEILLSTRLGERVMQPKYGCNLDVLLFEPINTSLRTYVKDLIQTAVLYFEPRIKVEKIAINTDRETEGLLLIQLDYVVRTTNSRHNFVYPFYQKEGTNL